MTTAAAPVDPADPTDPTAAPVPRPPSRRSRLDAALRESLLTSAAGDERWAAQRELSSPDGPSDIGVSALRLQAARKRRQADDLAARASSPSSAAPEVPSADLPPVPPSAVRAAADALADCERRMAELRAEAIMAAGDLAVALEDLAARAGMEETGLASALDPECLMPSAVERAWTASLTDAQAALRIAVAADSLSERLAREGR